MDANDQLCWYRSYDILTNVVGMCCLDLLCASDRNGIRPEKIGFGVERGELEKIARIARIVTVHDTRLRTNSFGRLNLVFERSSVGEIT